MHSYYVSGRFEEIHTLPKTTRKSEFEGHFEQTLHEMTGRLFVQLPHKSGQEGLGTPCDQGLYTVQQLKKRLQHQPDVRKNKADFMKEYEELGHMQVVAEVNGDDGKEKALPASSYFIQTR
jgi:hypothetical protein